MASEDYITFIQKEIAGCQKHYEAGNLGSLQDALVLCAENNLSLPDWVARAAIIMGKDAMLGNSHRGTHKGSGRNTKWIQQYKQDMIDFERAEIVEQCREHGIAWVDAFDAASAILGDTQAEGGADAVEKSYKRFKKRSESDPSRYHIVKSVRLSSSAMPYRPEVWKYVETLRRKKQGN